jgi:hypothetical protein
MQKVLISLPDNLAERMRYAIPAGQRSRILVRLIETEVTSREAELHQCALAVEQDDALHEEMSAWDVTNLDGILDEAISIAKQDVKK